jgi:Gram-negative pili assembly chaperone, N-terminal domain.
LKRFALLPALAFVSVLATDVQAQAPTAPTVTTTTVGANLNITPKRVTFSPTQRTASVYIFNQGTAPATFDIALIDRAMMPDGQIVAVEDAQKNPAQKAVADKVASARSMILISPRRATLAPGQGQTIRLRVGAVPPEAKGEYRTHLTVTTIPPPNVGTTAESAAAGASNELSFQITSVFGLSIPAIVRVTAPEVSAAIENPRIEYADLSADARSAPTRTAIAVFDLARTGASSLFGNIEIRPAGKRADPIGVARGVGVYPEIDRRTLRIPLSRIPAPGEKLEVSFTDDDTSPGKTLATVQIP